MERGFLNAYTYDAPPRGGAPPPKRPRSARGTGEIVEEEIQPTADEEIRPTQAGPSQTTQTSSQCGPGVEGRTYKHTCDEPNVEEGATAYCENTAVAIAARLPPACSVITSSWLALGVALTASTVM